MSAPRRPGCEEHDPRYCRPCETAHLDERYEQMHAGHTLVPGTRIRLDGRPYRRCVTCATAPADDIAVQRAAAGDPPPTLRPVERHAAVLQLHGQLPASVIAERIRCSRRTVERTLRAARTGAAA